MNQKPFHNCRHLLINMPKKVTFLLSILLCSSIIFAMQAPLTQQELTIYHSIVKEHPDIYNIRNILTTMNMSAQDVYNILLKQKNLLLLKGLYPSMTKSKIDTFIKELMEPSSYRFAPSLGDLISAFLIFCPLVLDIPIITTGLAVQKFMAPSHTKTVITSGLMGAGSILAAPTILLGLTIATGKVEKLLRNIIYYPKIKEINELENIENIIQVLKWRYPNLVTQQPTSP